MTGRPSAALLLLFAVAAVSGFSRGAGAQSDAVLASLAALRQPGGAKAPLLVGRTCGAAQPTPEQVAAVDEAVVALRARRAAEGELSAPAKRANRRRTVIIKTHVHVVIPVDTKAEEQEYFPNGEYAGKGVFTWGGCAARWFFRSFLAPQFAFTRDFLFNSVVARPKKQNSNAGSPFNHYNTTPHETQTISPASSRC